jgi:hypothetical protein
MVSQENSREEDVDAKANNTNNVHAAVGLILLRVPPRHRMLRGFANKSKLRLLRI